MAVTPWLACRPSKCLCLVPTQHLSVVISDVAARDERSCAEMELCLLSSRLSRVVCMK